MFLLQVKNWSGRFLVSSSMASDSKESPSNNPGLHTNPDEATKGYIMQQTVRCTLETLAHKFIMYNNLYPLLFFDL